MQCKDAQAMLDAWIDGELPEELHKAFEDHLRICKICSDEAEDLRMLNLCLDTHPPVQPSPNLQKRIMEAFVEASAFRDPVRWRTWWTSLGWQFQTAMAAGALIGLSIGCHLGGDWTGTQLLDQYSISGLLFSAGDLLLSWA